MFFQLAGCDCRRDVRKISAEEFFRFQKISQFTLPRLTPPGRRRWRRQVSPKFFGGKYGAFDSSAAGAAVDDGYAPEKFVFNVFGKASGLVQRSRLADGAASGSLRSREYFSRTADG